MSLIGCRVSPIDARLKPSGSQSSRSSQVDCKLQTCGTIQISRISVLTATITRIRPGPTALLLIWVDRCMVFHEHLRSRHDVFSKHDIHG